MQSWSSQGKFCWREHVPIGGSIFDVDCHVVTTSTQTQDNFVSDVFFHIIVTLPWFWLGKTWLFPLFLKHVIKMHVAKVALGVLHLNFLIAPGWEWIVDILLANPTIQEKLSKWYANCKTDWTKIKLHTSTVSQKQGHSRSPENILRARYLPKSNKAKSQEKTKQNKIVT